MARQRWTTDEHKAVQMLRGLQDEISQLKGDERESDETQLFRDTVDTAVASDSVSRTLYTVSAMAAEWDDDTTLGWDYGESE